jgi:hypothetical protein
MLHLPVSVRDKDRIQSGSHGWQFRRLSGELLLSAQSSGIFM